MEDGEQPLNIAKCKKRTLRQRFQYLNNRIHKENFPIEPVLFCYAVLRLLPWHASYNFHLDKACRLNLNYEDAVCDALIASMGFKYPEKETAVLKMVADMESWKNVILTAIPSFLILFVGAWSDKTRKRKICILLPIVGYLLASVSGIISNYFFYEMPLELCMFLEAFFPAVTGGWITMNMGAFCYISDVYSKEARTFRVGVAYLCLTVGGPIIGAALSGILLKKVGYYGVFSISSVLCLFSLFYGMYFIKDIDRSVLENVSEEQGFLKSFFNPKHVKETLQVAFKKGPNHRRTKSILVLASIAFIYGPSYGEKTVHFLFTRYRFNWDALTYSFYQTTHIYLHACGALISVIIFIRMFRWDDSVLGLISNASKFAGVLGTSLAKNGFQMYLAMVIETFNATSFTALRSISSKLVSSDELGKMMSLFNLTEVVTLMIFRPMYSWIYMQTLDFDAGFVYYVSTALTVPPIMIFGWFYRQHKIAAKKQPSLEDENGKVIELQTSLPRQGSFEFNG